MTVLASDDYNRADDTTLGSTPVGSLAYSYTQFAGSGAYAGISSGEGLFSDASGSHIWTLDPGISDGSVSLDLKCNNTGGYPFLACRLVDRSNFIGAQWVSGDGRLCLKTVVAGTETEVATTANNVLSANTYATVKITFSGTAIEVFLNGVSVMTATTSQFQTATKVGCIRYGGDSSFRFDNLLIEQPTAPVQPSVMTGIASREGAFGLTSWFFRARQRIPVGMLFRQTLLPNDRDATEETVWTKWFWPTTGQPALVLVGGVVRQILSAEVGTGLKPLVLLSNGTIAQRVTTEGSPLVLASGVIRTLSPTETLQI